MKNGQEISIENDVEKHLLKNMPYVKEAFFSKCVILVEGDTEFGAFPVFAKNLKIDLDDYGISVIQAGGAKSIPPLIKLFEKFGVNAVGLMDCDKYDEKYEDIKNLYFTDKQDFEEEIVSICIKKNQEDLLKDIVKNTDTKGLRREIDKKKLNSIIDKYDIDMEDFDMDYDFGTDNTDLLYPIFLAWLDINKSILLGRIIAECLPMEYIPQKFKTVIKKAQAVSQNV